MKFSTLSLLALACLGAGCDRAEAPPQPTVADLPYGPDERNVLDFWQARGDGPRPLIVFIHGGGWAAGNKPRSANRFLPYLENGVSYAAITYRLTPQNPLPAPVYDAVRAVQFIKSKATEWNVDPNRIALMGTSAGAASSMWILLHDDLADPNSPDPILQQSTRVAAAAVDIGQTSIDPSVIEPWLGPNVLQHEMIHFAVGEETIDAALTNYDRHRRLYEEFSPINHLSADDPPLLMTYGNNMTLPSIDEDHGIHHPVFGVKMKEKADGIGHETHLLIDGVSRSEQYESTQDFLLNVLLTR